MKARHGAVVIGVLALMAWARPVRACAGCSNPNLPTARGGVAALHAGEWSVALNLTATTMHVVHSEACPDIGPICAQRNEPAQLHDQRFYVGELRPILALGLTDAIGVEAQLPVRVLRSTVVFRRLDGTAFEPDYQNIHHRNETLAGIADPWLLVRASWTWGRFALTGRAGVGVPLGSTEPNPFALGRAGQSHQHIQFGTGTLYPVLAVDASVNLERVRVTSYAQALLFLYENGRGYLPGNRMMVGATGDLGVGGHVRVGLGADVVHEQPERWDGLVQQDGNVGRTDVLAGGAVSYRAGAVLASLAVRVPVYQHFLRADHHGDPGQLTYPAIVNFTVQYTFEKAVALAPPPASPAETR